MKNASLFYASWVIGGFLASAVLASADSLVKVKDVQDGNKLFMAEETTLVRLYGIAAPVLSQPFGREAKELVERFVGPAGRVWVEQKEEDEGGYMLSIVRHSPTKTLQEKLLEEGLAWVDRRYCTHAMCSAWEQLEAKARDARRGLWSAPGAIPPWQWAPAELPPPKRPPWIIIPY